MRSVFLCLLLAGCSAAESSMVPEGVEDRTQILAPHLSYPWRSGHCGMACGLPLGDGCRVWYTGNLPGGFQICRADFDKDWNMVPGSDAPCLGVGRPGEFDAAAVFMPCVIEAEGQLRMYYAAHEKGGFPGPASSTGLAVSLDGGATWAKAGQILTATGPDSGGVGTHCVFEAGGRWQMIYTRVVGTRPPVGGMRYVLCHAESQDGIHWTREPRNISLDHDGGTSARPSVWKAGGRFFMLYTHNAKAGRGPATYRIRLAESADGQHFEDRGQFLDVAKSGWDSQMVCYPWVIPARGVFLYTGNEFGKGGIGVAKLHFRP